MSINLFSLEGKVALVTGGTGYLGESMVIALCEAGAHVLVNSRDHLRAATVVNALRLKKFSADMAVFDVTDEKQISDYFSSVSDLKIDILVNNAYSGGGGTIESSTEKMYADSYKHSVIAAHSVLMGAIGNLRLAVKSGGEASVINVASIYGIVSPDLLIYESNLTSNPPFYGAAKAALIQFTKYAAVEFGAEGIRVNAISPGPFPSLETQINNPKLVERLEGKVPLGRIGYRHEINGSIIFLASGASSYVNGANLIVDGGWTSL